eukprot:jgi/Bigna1/75201/fgenesh1_pg.33_\
MSEQEGSATFGFQLISADVRYYEAEGKGKEFVANKYPEVGKELTVGRKIPLGWSQQKTIQWVELNASPHEIRLIFESLTTDTWRPGGSSIEYQATMAFFKWRLGRLDWWHSGTEEEQVIAENLQGKDDEQKAVLTAQSDIGNGKKQATAVYLKTEVVVMSAAAI